MIAKWSSFKYFCTVLLLAAFSATFASAKSTDTDSLPDYMLRQNNLNHFWQKLMPEMFTAQYAGNIGMISVGFGWDYGKDDCWETHLLFGFLPKRHKYHHYWTFTLREIYNPWNIHLDRHVAITPLSVNLSMNSILHHDFWMSEPDRYPHGYYGFSSRLRFQLGIGQRFTFNIPRHRRFLHSSVSLYYELSTTDLYIRQKFFNKAIPFKDTIALGVGVIYTL